MEPTRRTLDYAPPPPHSRRADNDFATRVAAWIAVGLLFVLIVGLSYRFQGRWYFWQRPTWVLSIDASGIFLGPSGNAFHLGSIPSLVLRVLIVAVPSSLIYHRVNRRDHPAPSA